MFDLAAKLSDALTGRYLVEEEIGKGGMAVVLRARDLKHDRWVALKVLRPELSASLGAQRFLREIRLAAGLQHPHILPLYDSGEAGGFVYYVMPLVEGESLRQRLEHQRQLSVEEAVNIAREIADGLQYAHERDIVHRDIKPENILLSGGHALIADFGIARAISAAQGPTLTETGFAVGTPAYMSPEQAMGEPRVDGRADVYALGCVMYEMLAGEPPFRGATHFLIAQHSAATPRSLRALRPAVPPTVDAAIARALAKSPADRFDTAAEFKSALQATHSRQMGASSSRGWKMALGAAFAGAAALAAAFGVNLRRPQSQEMITIAVAPIRNQGDSSDASFADGLTQELSAALTRVDRIAPRPYSSVMIAAATRKDPLELGRELGVDYVLQATLRRSHNQLRLLSELIRVKDGTNAWSPQSFQGSDSDLFQMQDSIAKQLTHELASTFVDRFASGRRSHKPDPEAYKLYLQAHTAPLGSRQAVDLYRAVVERDPKFADGWAALAQAYDWWAQVSGEPPSVILARKTEAINRALSLDSLNGEAWIYRANTTRTQDWDYERADGEHKRAILLIPTSAWAHIDYAQFLHSLGRTGAAHSELELAKRLDPANSHLVMMEGYFLQADGHLAQADSVLKRALALDPRNWVAHLMRAKTALKAGKPVDAVTHMEAAQRLQGPDDPFTLSFLAYFSAAAKQEEKARSALARLTAVSKDRYVQRAWFAIARLGLRDTEGALTDLEASATLREVDFMTAMIETATALWREPRYQKLVRRAKLDAYWSRPPRA